MSCPRKFDSRSSTGHDAGRTVSTFYPPGRYQVEFFLRATGAGEGPAATLDVYDASAEDILASRVLTGDYAHGGSDLELACVRVR